jgi:hypothetical protein
MNLLEIKSVLKQKSEDRKFGCEIISDLHHANQAIRSKSPKTPAFKLDLSSTILKVFTESGV